MDQQRAQIGVAALADAKQSRLAAAGRLPGHQAQPGGKLSSVLEVLGITDGRDERTGSDRADAGNLLELAACLALAVRSLDLCLEFTDLAIEFLEVIEQTLDQQPKAAWQFVARILDEIRHLGTDVRDPLRDDEPELGQQPTNLVGQGGTCADKSLAHTMHRENGLARTSCSAGSLPRKSPRRRPRRSCWSSRTA